MNLNDLAVLIRVVEDGSLTAAAERLDIPKSSVSRTLSRLEAGLGVRLLQRTTRSLHLTDAGRQFYDRVRRNLEDIEDAERALSEWQSSPRGHLRITMPVELGMRFMGSVVAEFMQKYPGVSLEAELSGRLVDLVEEGVDLGLRIGDFNDANLIGRRLGQLCGRFFASPGYIAREGMPATPEALAERDFVLFRQARENHLAINYPGPDGTPLERRITVRGRLSTNNAHLMMDAVSAGLGIGMLPAFLTDNAVAEGRLVPVLPLSQVRLGDLWAMTPSRTHMSSALRAFLDFLAERVREHPWFVV